MTNRTHSLRNAGSAIAAALAIISTPGFAQDAAAPFPATPDPVVVVPDIPAAVVERPSIVVPPVQTETVQPLPAPSAETPESQAAPPPVAATALRTRATAPAAASTTPERAPRAATPVPAAVEDAAPLPPETTVEPVIAEPVVPVATTEPVRTASNDNGILALILGGLVFLALAIWGFVAIGRRKHVRRYAAESTTRPMAIAPTPVVAEPAPVAAREPVALAPRAEPRPSSFAPRPAAVSGALSHAGASVALPARVPEDYAERDALIKRMIAAKPDRANPFTDRGARTRRARLILQSLGRDFGQTEPWIDLSQYPNNWPELANKRSNAA
jgi:hypothetical protein